MSFGGGSTSDIGDPRTGEATYAGTSSVAGTAQQMGRNVDDVAAAMDYYQSVMDMADENNIAIDNQRLASEMAAASMPQQAAPSQADIEAGLLSMQGQIADLQRQNRIADLAGVMTPVNFARTGAVGNISSLENLAMRAGLAPKPSSQGFASMMPSFLSAAGSKIGQMATSAMYNDVVEKGYIPQYDSVGQIVATINPETGQYGRGSVPARIAGYEAPQESDSQAIPEPTVKTLEEKQQTEPVSSGIQPYMPITSGDMYYRRTLLDEAPQFTSGLFGDITPQEYEAMNREFLRSGATSPAYFQDPYDLTGYSVLI